MLKFDRYQEAVIALVLALGLSATFNLLGIQYGQEWILEKKKDRFLEKDYELLRMMDEQIKSQRKMGPLTTYELVSRFSRLTEKIQAKKDSLEQAVRAGRGDFFEKTFGLGWRANAGRLFVALVPCLALLLAVRAHVYGRGEKMGGDSWLDNIAGLIVFGGFAFSGLANAVSIIGIWGDTENTAAILAMLTVGFLFAGAELVTYKEFFQFRAQTRAAAPTQPPTQPQIQHQFQQHYPPQPYSASAPPQAAPQMQNDNRQLTQPQPAPQPQTGNDNLNLGLFDDGMDETF